MWLLEFVKLVQVHPNMGQLGQQKYRRLFESIDELCEFIKRSDIKSGGFEFIQQEKERKMVSQ